MKKLAIFLAEGFEEIEALTIADYLKRANIEAVTVSINEEKTVEGSHSIKVVADKTFDQVDFDEFDALYIPGGLPGAYNLKDSEKVVNTVKKFHDENKIIAAICAGPVVLEKAGIISDKSVTSYPSFKEKLNPSKYEDEKTVVKDKNVLTARGAACAIYLAFELVKTLNPEFDLDELKEGIQYNAVERIHGLK